MKIKETLDKRPNELTEEELAQVTGGGDVFTVSPSAQTLEEEPKTASSINRLAEKSGLSMDLSLDLSLIKDTAPKP